MLVISVSSCVPDPASHASTMMMRSLPGTRQRCRPHWGGAVQAGGEGQEPSSRGRTPTDGSQPTQAAADCAHDPLRPGSGQGAPAGVDEAAEAEQMGQGGVHLEEERARAVRSISQRLARARRNHARGWQKLAGRPELAKAARVGRASHGHPHTLVFRNWLYVQESPLAGQGVFAGRDFASMQPLLVGSGTIVPVDASDQHYSFAMQSAHKKYRHYAFECLHDEHTNMIKYINSAVRTRLAQNAEVFWHGAVPVVYCAPGAMIRKGQEVLLGYQH